MTRTPSALLLALVALMLHPITEGKDMKVRITLDNSTHHATLVDNPTTRNLMQHLPLTLPLEDYAVSEKIARPNFKLNTAQAPARYRGKPGDITYYAPWGNLALFYKGGPDAAGLVYLGKFDSDYQAALKQAKRMKIEVVK